MTGYLRSADTGYKVLKIVIAYFRTLNFEETGLWPDMVFRIFKLGITVFERVDFVKDELKPLQDFLVPIYQKQPESGQ